MDRLHLSQTWKFYIQYYATEYNQVFVFLRVDNKIKMFPSLEKEKVSVIENGKASRIEMATSSLSLL